VKYGAGNIYCIISSSDGASSEVAFTQKTGDISEGSTQYFAPETATVWGQMGLKKSTNNITVTFNCWTVKSDAAANVLNAISDAAKAAGGIPGIGGPAYGWAFGLGSVAASAAAAGASAANANDAPRFDQQQTIPASALLDLANGRTWEVRWATKDQCWFHNCFDWTMTLQAWGCADAAPQNPK
jgi:hypothetical protein